MRHSGRPYHDDAVSGRERDSAFLHHALFGQQVMNGMGQSDSLSRSARRARSPEEAAWPSLKNISDGASRWSSIRERRGASGNRSTISLASISGGSRTEVISRHAHARHSVAERTIRWLSQSRRISKDYGRLCETSQTMIYAVMSQPPDAEELARI